MNVYRDHKEQSNIAGSHSKSPRRETMSVWLERQASSHHVQLAATAVLSGLAVAGIIYGTQTARRKVAIDKLKASIPELDEDHQAQKVCFARDAFGMG